MSNDFNFEPLKRKYGFYSERFNFNQNRFHAIYFVDKITGTLLVSNRYSDIVSNRYSDLIGGFLSAINTFIKEINDDEIQEINFKDSRILYERKGRLICIAISKKTDLQIERKIVKDILYDFYYRFENQISQFDGHISPEILSYKKRLQELNLNSIFRFNIKL